MLLALTQGWRRTWRNYADVMMIQPEQPEQPEHNVALKDLSGLLRGELQPQREGDTLVSRSLHALLDVGRMRESLRVEIEKKLKKVSFKPLLLDPEFAEFRLHYAYLVSGLDSEDAALFEKWVKSNSDFVSAWIVTELSAFEMASHLRKAIFAWDETTNTRYMLRFYDPLITPVLHRVADRKWVDWFFGPILAWWYPVATPQERTWSRIEGGGQNVSEEPPLPLTLTEEIVEALDSYPLQVQTLNLVEQRFPSAFESDDYGVRLAKIEELLEDGKKQGLRKENDLIAYVLYLLENTH